MSKHFSVTPAGNVTGPQAYMNERFPSKRIEIEAGACPVFNYGLRTSPNWQVALEVALETDYNSWSSTRKFIEAVTGHKGGVNV